MIKYIFDVVRREQDRCEYDCKGRMLVAPEKAFDFAQLALDLEMKRDGEWRAGQ